MAKNLYRQLMTTHLLLLWWPGWRLFTLGIPSLDDVPDLLTMVHGVAVVDRCHQWHDRSIFTV